MGFIPKPTKPYSITLYLPKLCCVTLRTYHLITRDFKHHVIQNTTRKNFGQFTQQKSNHRGVSWVGLLWITGMPAEFKLIHMVGKGGRWVKSERDVEVIAYMETAQGAESLQSGFGGGYRTVPVLQSVSTHRIAWCETTRSLSLSAVAHSSRMTLRWGCSCSAASADTVLSTTMAICSKNCHTQCHNMYLQQRVMLEKKPMPITDLGTATRSENCTQQPHESSDTVMRQSYNR